MRGVTGSLFAVLALGGAVFAEAQGGHVNVPKSIIAGSAFSISNTTSSKGLLYIIGPAQALRRDLEAGETASFPRGVLYSAGHYVAILANQTSIDTGEFDVMPAPEPATLSFLAKPSRLPVGLHNGISGAVYVFDTYNNLITTPMPASLQLSVPSGPVREKTVPTRNGMAWAEMDSAAKEGSAKFIARVGNVSSTRVIDEVPGDPCRLSISARPDAGRIEVETAPVRDCSGNAIPDGTIVTFTETFNNTVSTVDAPIKQGVARVHMPAYSGARISVASGVVAGNEIRWQGGR